MYPGSFRVSYGSHVEGQEQAFCKTVAVACMLLTYKKQRKKKAITQINQTFKLVLYSFHRLNQ